jgi:hypothetical protein
VGGPLEHVGTSTRPTTTALLLARETHFRHDEGVDYAVVRSEHLHRLADPSLLERRSTSATAAGRLLRASARSARPPARRPTRAAAATCASGRPPRRRRWRVSGRRRRPRSCPTSTPTSAAPQLLLALADDELITGHRASHWTGVAPSLEEDLAFSTIAQDEINHADVWYQVLVGGHRDRGPPSTRWARPVRRRPTATRSCASGHPATSPTRWPATGPTTASTPSGSARWPTRDGDVAAVATKLLHEERYHLEHADHWFARLTTGGDAYLHRAHPGARW